jgi:hypothetical protein
MKVHLTNQTLEGFDIFDVKFTADEVTPDQAHCVLVPEGAPDRELGTFVVAGVTDWADPDLAILAGLKNFPAMSSIALYG